MAEFLTHHRKKLFIVFLISALLMVGLCAQLGFLMIARSDHYSKMADELHKRERTIKAARGEICCQRYFMTSTALLPFCMRRMERKKTSMRSLPAARSWCGSWSFRSRRSGKR